MKRTLSLLLMVAAFMAAAVVANAQEGNGAKTGNETKKKVRFPEAKTLFRKYVEALGGRDRLEKIKSRVATGTVTLLPMGLNGTFEISGKAPDKMLVSISLPQFGEILDGFDGIQGWAKNPLEGFRLKKGEELERSKENSDFYLNLNLEKHYPNAKVTGLEKGEEGEWYVVKADGDTTLYFDSKTSLMIRTDRVAITPNGKVPTQTYIGDYREINGLKQPYSVRQSMTGADFQFNIEELKFNVEIDDAKFASKGK